MPYLAISHDGGETWSKPMMVAAPGVTEAQLPDIAATPGGRVAMFYLGSTDSPGEPYPQNVTCLGVQETQKCLSDNGPFNDAQAVRYQDITWNGFITMTFDGDAKNPVFFSASVNPPGDPLARGVCGPRPDRCNLGDFQDIQMAPNGMPWASLVDACTPEPDPKYAAAHCVTPTSSADKANNAGHGVVGRLFVERAP